MLRAPGKERQSSDSGAQKAKTQHSQQASGWTIFNLPPLHIGQSLLEVFSLPVLPKNSCRPTKYLIGREGDNGERRPITRDILLKQNLRIWSNKLGRNQVGHRLLSRISEMDELIYDEAKGNFISWNLARDSVFISEDGLFLVLPFWRKWADSFEKSRLRFRVKAAVWGFSYERSNRAKRRRAVAQVN